MDIFLKFCTFLASLVFLGACSMASSGKEVTEVIDEDKKFWLQKFTIIIDGRRVQVEYSEDGLTLSKLIIDGQNHSATLFGTNLNLILDFGIELPNEALLEEIHTAPGYVSALSAGTALPSHRGIFILLISSEDGLETKTYTMTLLNTSRLGEVFEWVDGGSFLMGSVRANDNRDYDSLQSRPVRSVNLSGFYISKYEVDNKKYTDFLNEIGVSPNGTFEGVAYINLGNSSISHDGSVFTSSPSQYHFPVGGVSWFGAQAYSQWLGGRLPTEAEWEYAARGGSLSQGYTFSGSNNLDDVAWYHIDQKEARAVGQKEPNELGLYDMSGNMWEWCLDWGGPYVEGDTELVDPTGPEMGENRVLRGGAYLYRDGELYSPYFQSTHRYEASPSERDGSFGFRPVLVP